MTAFFAHHSRHHNMKVQHFPSSISTKTKATLGTGMYLMNLSVQASNSTAAAEKPGLCALRYCSKMITFPIPVPVPNPIKEYRTMLVNHIAFGHTTELFMLVPQNGGGPQVSRGAGTKGPSPAMVLMLGIAAELGDFHVAII